MSQKNPQIFVTRLPRDITDEELRKTFRKFGKIKEVTLKRGYGFVVSIFSF
jgi:RNA recognition motif-containing protein